MFELEQQSWAWNNATPPTKKPSNVEEMLEFVKLDFCVGCCSSSAGFLCTISKLGPSSSPRKLSLFAPGGIFVESPSVLAVSPLTSYLFSIRLRYTSLYSSAFKSNWRSWKFGNSKYLQTVCPSCNSGKRAYHPSHHWLCQPWVREHAWKWLAVLAWNRLWAHWLWCSKASPCSCEIRYILYSRCVFYMLVADEFSFTIKPYPSCDPPQGHKLLRDSITPPWYSMATIMAIMGSSSLKLAFPWPLSLSTKC